MPDNHNFDHITPTSQTDLIGALERSALILEFNNWLGAIDPSEFAAWRWQGDNDPED